MGFQRVKMQNAIQLIDTSSHSIAIGLINYTQSNDPARHGDRICTKKMQKSEEDWANEN